MDGRDRRRRDGCHGPARAHPGRTDRPAAGRRRHSAAGSARGRPPPAGRDGPADADNRPPGPSGQLDDWVLALALASGEWALDAAGLYAACRAFDIDISVLQLAGLVAIGAPDTAATAATAAVLLYRLVSAWLMIPLGYLAMAGLTGWDRRHSPHEAVTES